MKISIRQIRNTVLVLLVMTIVWSIAFGIGFRKGSGISEGRLDMSLLWEVRGLLRDRYLDKKVIDDKKMTYGAIRGAVESLDDPYTVFLPPEQNKMADEDLASEFGGVGISLGFKEKTLAVMAPLAKTPAERAGLKAGDLILKIVDENNGVDRDTAGISLSEAVSLIRGKEGTEVKLEIYREGKSEPFDVSLVREKIVVPTLELEWKDVGERKIAWIRLYKFSENLVSEWNKIAEEIIPIKKSGKLAGIILDLRDNPGGYLDGSVFVASDFLREGLVVTQANADGSKQDMSVDKSMARFWDDKLIVLINGGSASASEILAGALKSHGRAKLVGEKSFGKGTVQEPDNFSDGSGINITIAKWLLPDGTNIHGKGIEPDEMLVWSDDKEKEAEDEKKVIELFR